MASTRRTYGLRMVTCCVRRITGALIVHEPAGGEPLLLGTSDVERALTLDVAFASQREAFLSLARGEAVSPDKLTLPGAPGTAWTLCYAARTAPEGGVVVKVVGGRRRRAQSRPRPAHGQRGRARDRCRHGTPGRDHGWHEHHDPAHRRGE